MTRRTLMLILLAGGLARLLSLPLVFDGGGLCFAGGPDAYYHFRRAELAAAGALTKIDLWTNFPHGDSVHWPSLYSHFLGFILGAGGQISLIVVPVFFGLLSLIALKSWTEKLLDAKAAIALSLFAILPASVMLTMLGAIDHHCLEALLFIIVLSGGPFAALAALLIAYGTITTWPVLLVGYFVREMMTGKRALALTGGIIGAVAIPLLAWNYFADPWLAEIKEANPMITGLKDFIQSFKLISLGMLAIPFALPRWWRIRTERPAAAAISAAIVTLPLALLQIRFVVFLAVPAVLAIAEVTKIIAEKFRPRLGYVFLFAAVCLSLSGLFEIPTWGADPPRATRRALEYLRNETPSAGNYLDPQTKPAYGVVASWELGHSILALGMRPAVAGAFHTGIAGREIAHHILFSDAAGAAAAADSNSVRYLLLTNLHGEGYLYRNAKGRGEGSLFDRLYFSNDPSLGWTRVFASPETFEYAGKTIPSAQVWERTAPKIL